MTPGTEMMVKFSVLSIAAKQLRCYSEELVVGLETTLEI